MQPIYRHRSVVAFLASLLFWSTALFSVVRSAEGASLKPTPIPSAVLKAEDALQRTAQMEARQDRKAAVRATEWERQTEHLESSHQLKQKQESQRREAVARRIADLVPDQYTDLVLDVAEQNNMDPRLLAALVTVESRWNARAIGSHGDSGLMQILPSTAEWIASKLGLASYDLYDPLTNLRMGAWYLNVLHREYGDWNMALAGYNGGPKGAPLGSQHPYTQRVMRVFLQGS